MHFSSIAIISHTCGGLMDCFIQQNYQIKDIEVEILLILGRLQQLTM